MGHVNNTIYFRFFESVRIEYMIQMGMFDRKGDKAVTPILASTKCDFKFPLTYPDIALASGRCVRVGKTSFTMEYRIESKAHGVVAAKGEGVIVVLSALTRAPVEIDDELRARITKIEAWEERTL